ncbi:MAG: hypothetical protein IPM39_08775 [Chloroflexi bacterium]|nr:hypothetical protein [Chloroflexota bacterium]
MNYWRTPLSKQLCDQFTPGRASGPSCPLHAGRARWKHENEGHNVLTTHGYHIKHNFGHGQEHFDDRHVTLNLLAFFLHTFLELVDTTYKRIRAALGARRLL